VSVQASARSDGNQRPDPGSARPSRSGGIPGWSSARPPLTGDIAAPLGLDNVYGDHADRYPHVSLHDRAARRPSLVVLPDEPYPFSAADGPEMFPHQWVALVAVSWLAEAFAKAGRNPALGTRLWAIHRQAGLCPLGMIGIQPHFGPDDPAAIAALAAIIRLPRH
jgi:hypothetical protein